MARPGQDPGLEAIRAAWSRYAILLSGLGLVLLVITVVLWPRPYEFAVEQFMLPQYEQAFGFRGGRLALGEGPYTMYALVAVVPGGTLARAGVTSGDIPVEYHSGVLAFYAALQNARAGRQGRFDVLAHSDWPDWGRRRNIVLKPEGKSKPR